MPSTNKQDRRDYAAAYEIKNKESLTRKRKARYDKQKDNGTLKYSSYQNSPAQKAKMAKWRANNKKYMKNYARVYRLKNKYNMTVEEYQDLLEYQNCLCAICFQQSDNPLHIDHDHNTGEVRGLLCHNCNIGIGMLKESTEILRSSIDYLNKRKMSW